MSGYILCQTKRTEVPYYIENIGTNIYSLEELCFYLYHNLYLIDRSVMNEELCSWIQQELDLPKLAQKLRARLGKGQNLEEFLYPVFKEINYLSYEELRSLNGRIRQYEEESPVIRKKRKGDALAENGMYVNAIRIYQDILEESDVEKTKPGLTEKLYHNMGCAYSYLFHMEKALECFWKAYEAGGSQRALKSYLLAFHFVRTPIEYESRMTELKVKDQLRQEIEQALEQFSRKPEEPVYSQHIDAMIERFTKEYHRSTGS